MQGRDGRVLFLDTSSRHCNHLEQINTQKENDSKATTKQPKNNSRESSSLFKEVALPNAGKVEYL
jgi:hypothetical protein